MLKILHVKFIIGTLLISCLAFLVYRNKRRIMYRFKERLIRIRRGFGYRTGLNDNFADDLESGLSSRNFDLISRNASDKRHGLDLAVKEAIKEIMEREKVEFDKARLLYTERTFGQNNIAPDGTPLDPKAFTFH